MAWADEPLTPGAQTARIIRSEPGLAPATASLAEMVARELGFRPDLSVQQLTDRWRAYVWRNHPDRQPALARDEANARVAVANALYDSARHAFGRI